jgi:adenosylhomocysteine nucleosidase
MADKPSIVVIVSANAEWRVVKELLPQAAYAESPFGECFTYDLGCGDMIFFHGGWGKISAAASAQYVIDHFAPRLLVNLGTCGGFEGRVERGTILLVERTIVYDIIEQMGDNAQAIAHYTTDLDLSWLTQPYPHPVQRCLLVSADRDIVKEDIPQLVSRYEAVAADWESGAIAWVAQRSGVRCLILRGVTDLVSTKGGEAYGDYEMFVERAREIMRQLIEQLPDWIRKVDL